MKHKDEMPIEEQQAFDRWFFSLPRWRQNVMRKSGVLPYREMFTSKYPFAIKEDHPSYVTHDEPYDHRPVQSETFYSKTHVTSMLTAILESLSLVRSPAIKAHVAIIRHALGIGNDRNWEKSRRTLTHREIARIMGISHFAVQWRINVIKRRIATAMDAASFAQAERMEKRPKWASKESFNPGGCSCVAPHHGKKTCGDRRSRKG